MMFDISFQNLTTLKGINFPEGITELDCSNNSLTSLQYCPSSVRTLNCTSNSLTSLQYCPNSVIYLYCANNSLTSLQYCPKSVISLDCHNNSLTSLQYCPISVKYLYSFYNPLSSEYMIYHTEEIHKINTVKSYKLGIDRLNLMISSVKIQRGWKKYWYDELDDNGINRYCKFALNQSQCDGILT